MTVQMWSLGYFYDTIFGKYGKMSISTAPSVDSLEDCYFINHISVTPKEAKMVLSAMRRHPWTDELTAADFVDLKEVKKILEKVCAKRGRDEQ